jgi:DNA-binding NtrC family response regulator
MLMSCATPNVLLVDNDSGYVHATSNYAKFRGCEVFSAGTLKIARNAVYERSYDLALMDPCLPDGSGLDLLESLALRKDGRAIVLTGPTVPEPMVHAIHRSSLDCLAKPMPQSKLDQLLDEALSRATTRHHSDDRCGALVGHTPVMRNLFSQIRRIAPLDVTVLLHGESGTGKELAAKALHEFSGRKGKLVSVNCGGIAADLLTSQLFGHQRGSFTGAVRDHPGYFEQADQGTLLLDEITEMPPGLQAHLLRVLEDRVVTRVGSVAGRKLDVRVVAACNRPPAQAVRDGSLRADLYYRLADFPLRMPSLREHPADIPQLAEHLLASLNRRHDTRRYFAPSAMARLLDHDWPGNVRELRHAIQRAFVLSDGAINFVSIEPSIRPDADDTSQLDLRVGMTMEDMERRVLLQTLAFFDNDRARTADALGISLKTVYNKLTRYAKADRAKGGA